MIENKDKRNKNTDHQLELQKYNKKRSLNEKFYIKKLTNESFSEFIQKLSIEEFNIIKMFYNSDNKTDRRIHKHKLLTNIIEK